MVVDFDGTLSEIAPTPGDARIYPRNAIALRDLSEKLPLVAVLSGRGAGDLAERVAIPKIVYVGNHGAEQIVNGKLVVPPGAAVQTSAMLNVLDFLRCTVSVAGLVFEDKRFSGSVHFRGTADPAESERRLRDAIARAPGSDQLDVFWGKMVLELRPARALNKGDAIETLVSDYSLDAVAFVGDDTTDVDGMRSLSRLPIDTALRIAVLSTDMPQSLLEAAEFAVASVQEVATLLERIAALRTAQEV